MCASPQGAVSGWLSQGTGKAWFQNQRQNRDKELKHERGFSSLPALGEALQGAALRQPENSSEPPTTMEKIKIKAKFTQNGVSSTC